jgi:hypothetical protein
MERTVIKTDICISTLYIEGSTDHSSPIGLSIESLSPDEYEIALLFNKKDHGKEYEIIQLSRSQLTMFISEALRLAQIWDAEDAIDRTVTRIESMTKRVSKKKRRAYAARET